MTQSYLYSQQQQQAYLTKNQSKKSTQIIILIMADILSIGYAVGSIWYLALFYEVNPEDGLAMIIILPAVLMCLFGVLIFTIIILVRDTYMRGKFVFAGVAIASNVLVVFAILLEAYATKEDEAGSIGGLPFMISIICAGVSMYYYLFYSCTRTLRADPISK